MSVVAELEAGLQRMLALKPPGVSGSRIQAITALCVSNVQSESVLIQKIYTHFKKTPGTHKLGVLYVVDSVTRKWMEQAKSQGQPINSSAPDGTFAAGVHRVTELMPVLMNDILSSAPEDQKEKIRKLVDIWEKGQTFPPRMLESFKEKINAPSPPKASTTPPGSPPANPLASLGNGNKAAPSPALPNLMETLANIARQNASAAQSNPSLTAPAAQYSASAQTSITAPQGLTHRNEAPGMPFVQSSQPGAPAAPAAPAASAAPAVNLAALSLLLSQQAQQGQQGQHQAVAPLNGAGNQANGFNGNPNSNPNQAAPQVNQQLLLIQTLAQQGVPLETITSIIAQMSVGVPPGAPAQLPPQLPPQMQPQIPAPVQSGYAAPPPLASWSAPRPEESRDQHPYHDPLRSPNRHRGRSRSRSPGRHWDTHDSPRGRGGDRGYDYGRNSPGRGRFDDHDRDRDRGRDADRGRGGRGQDYRQRSPPGRRGLSPSRDRPPNSDKWVEYDPSLPNGTIKVLSRTLFVGGVTISEADLRSIFSRHGQVQTCIVNKDKRHAFVKMYYRKDAVHAKEAMEEGKNHENSLRTRWGVGFGPRDCSDYATGISVIPISKLTEADRKWMLTAEFGGSGGRPIVTGLCVEEPDIEIGAGVSSKAISRRMQTDKSGSTGPKSTRKDDDDHHHSGGGRWRRGGRDGHRGDGRRDGERGGGDRGGGDRATANDQPVVPEFGFGIAMGPNGMPIFPPGFKFPAPDA